MTAQTIEDDAPSPVAWNVNRTTVWVWPSSVNGYWSCVLADGHTYAICAETEEDLRDARRAIDARCAPVPIFAPPFEIDPAAFLAELSALGCFKGFACVDREGVTVWGRNVGEGEGQPAPHPQER